MGVYLGTEKISVYTGGIAVKNSGQYVWSKHETENGKVIITGYNGSLSGELVIPETRTVATIRHTYE